MTDPNITLADSDRQGMWLFPGILRRCSERRLQAEQSPKELLKRQV